MVIDDLAICDFATSPNLQITKSYLAEARDAAYRG
jgi:hypothetical protein